MIDKILRKPAKNRHIAQMGIQRPLAVGLIELRAKRLALLQHVKDVAQHLQHRAIGFSTHRGRARIIIHARHFAKKLAGSKFGNGMVVRQVHWRIDGNRPPVHLLLAPVFVPGGQTACELAGQPPEKSSRPAARFYVRHRAGQLHAGLALQNVKRGRAEFSFTADNIPAFEMAPYGGIRVFFQELRRDVLKDGQLEEVFGRNGRAIGLPLDIFQFLKNQGDAPRKMLTARIGPETSQISYNRPQRSSPSSAAMGFPWGDESTIKDGDIRQPWTFVRLAPAVRG